MSRSSRVFRLQRVFDRLDLFGPSFGAHRTCNVRAQPRTHAVAIGSTLSRIASRSEVKRSARGWPRLACSTAHAPVAVEGAAARCGHFHSLASDAAKTRRCYLVHTGGSAAHPSRRGARSRSISGRGSYVACEVDIQHGGQSLSWWAQKRSSTCVGRVGHPRVSGALGREESAGRV